MFMQVIQGRTESQEPPPELQDAMNEWRSLMESPTFIDLRSPWMASK